MSKGAVVQAADPGVRLLAGETVAATVPANGGNIVVNVLNATPAGQLVTVAVVGLPGGAGASGLPADAFSAVLAANKQRAVSLKVPPLKAGSYVGSVVAFGADGTSDSRQLQLTVEAPDSGAPVTPVPGTLALPLPPKVVVAAELMWPTPLTDLRLSWLGQPIHLDNAPFGTVSVPVDPNTGSKVSISLLQSADGRRATAVVKDDQVVIGGLAGAGQYDGTIAVGAGSDQKTTALSVVARDHVFWALLALIGGLALAGTVNDYLSRIRPRNALRVLIADLEASTITAQDGEATWWKAAGQRSLREWVGEGAQPYKIYEPAASQPANRGALYAEAEGGLTLFDETGSTEDRAKRFSIDGTAFLAIEGDLTKLKTLYEAVHRMGALYQRIAIPESAGGEGVPATPAVTGAREAMTGRLLLTRPELDTAATAVAGALVLMARFADLANYYAAILEERKNKDPEIGKVEIEAARSALLSPGHKDVESFKDVETKLDAAWAAVATRVWRRASEAEGAHDRSTLDVGPIVDGLGRVAPPTAEAAELRRDLRRADRLFDGLAALLTIGSGLSLLYFSKSTFGSTGDYLGVLVWGTATKEVLSLVRRFGPFSTL